MILTLFVSLFKGMISYMNKYIFILGMAIMASVCFIRVAAAAPDKLILLQDENFFLQDEIRKLHAELVDKDNAVKKVLLERETARYELGLMVKEKEALEDKVASLYKLIAARDEEFPRKVELASLPYRSQVEDAVDQLKAMTIALEEKNVQAADLMKEVRELKEKTEILTAEKRSLLQSVRKISAEHDLLKAQVDDKLSDAEAEAQDKIRDFQVRLAAEQTLVHEKIAQVRKPLEEKIAGMVQDMRMLEQQIVLLKDQAGSCAGAGKK